MSDPDVDVVEFMLTTKLFNDRRDLDPDDLPPAYRAPFWSDATIERPLTADQGAIAEATDVERPWEAISSLMFTDRDEFAGTVDRATTDALGASQALVDAEDDDRYRLDRKSVV